MNPNTIRWRLGAALAACAVILLVVVAGCPQGSPPADTNGQPAAGSDNSGPADTSNADDGSHDGGTEPTGDDSGSGSGAGDNAADDSGADNGSGDVGGNEGSGGGGVDDGNGDAGGDGNGGDNPTGDDSPPDDSHSIAFTFDPSTLTGRYLMAFHGCEGGDDTCSSPDNHRVYIASSDDGLTWTVPDGWSPYAGSVPDVIERGESLYIYTPNRVVIADLTTGEVTEPIEVEVEGDGLPAGFVDPSPILDDQGRIVLFFIAGSLDGAIGTCAGGETTCTVNVYSATETADLDGIHFTLDAGARAEVPVDIESSVKTATDPDIYFDGTQYVLYVSHGPSMSVWTSTTLTGSYSPVTTLPDSMLTWGTGGVGSGMYDDDAGVYWTYAHVSSGQSTVIRRAVHADFTSPLDDEDFSVVIEGADLGYSGDSTAASPGVWKRW